ncbi:unnamed protein product, partial [Mesorhabditis spiculigera]
MLGCLSGGAPRNGRRRRSLSESPPPLPPRTLPQGHSVLAPMSRLFNWKLRLGLGRKTPEPRESVAVHIAENSMPPPAVSSQEQKSPRVRFDETPTVQEVWNGGPPNPEYRLHPHEISTPPGDAPKPYPGYALPTAYPYNSVQQLGTIQEIDYDIGDKKPQRGDWSYDDDVKVTIAPVNQNDIPKQNAHRDSTRASTVLQNLREQADHIEFNERRRQLGTNPQVGGTLPGPSPVPEHSNTIDRSMNLPRASPIQQNRHFIEPQSSAKRDWDDMNVVFLQANDEVKRVVLPPRIDAMEQIKMAFVRVFPHITRSYIEQPFVKIYIQDAAKGLFYELDDLREVRNKTVLRLREQRAGGVASPVRHLEHPDYHSEAEYDDRNAHRFVSLARPASAMARARDPYYDSYSSDASESRANSVARSGSATPIIDREARDRMECMERQLAGLSSLVHTALVSKGMPESAQKDMADLRRQILALHQEAERVQTDSYSTISEQPSPGRDLLSIRDRVHAAGSDCRQLKSSAQANAHEAKKLLEEASHEITKIVSHQMAGSAQNIHRLATPQPFTKEQLDQERALRNEHEKRTRDLVDNLTNFEQNVETLRSSVLTANRKLRMSEVEQLTERLTQLGRTAASIKTDFPNLQTKIEARLKEDMERVVRDEKYIREETTAVDQSLRRCKALANIMVTMKKLAMVQDPSLSRGSSGRHSSSSKVPPAPHNYPRTEPSSTHAMTTTSLDSVLDEMQNIPAVPHPPATASTQHPAIQMTPTGQPPRPPSRTSVSDVRSKFKQPPELPEQIRSLIEDAKRSSPSLESQSGERPKTLEERQKELAEKQRQLATQFHQMQTAPPS